MSPLRQAIANYLSMRRALGFKLYRQGKALESFVRFAECEGATKITTDLALRWARLPSDVTSATWAHRLALVRRFARYLSASDPQTEVPHEGLLPHRFRRRSPYIYRGEEIRRLLQATRQLSPGCGLRPLTYETLFGLLAATGMRIGEALALDDADVDLTSGILTVRDAKFGKTRYVPVHPSTRHALRRYAQRRRRCLPQRKPAPYFATEQGNRLSYSAVRWVFLRLLCQAEIRATTGQRHPRIHDIRHTFVVRTLLRWYRSDTDVEAYLPRLVTYLGHGHLTDTYWYFSAVPELLRCAQRRLERAARRFPS